MSKLHKNALPSQAELLAMFSYDAESGALLWRQRAADTFEASRRMSAVHRCNLWNSRFAGKVALNAGSKRYAAGHPGGLHMTAHRVIWKMVHGTEPGEIDHINGDPRDNRIANLRDVSRTENARNNCVRSDNTSGVTGVEFVPSREVWAARIGVDGRQRYLGTFHSFETAVAARQAAEVELGYHPNHGRRAA